MKPVPNTGPIKFVPLAAGVAGGLAIAAGLQDRLVEPDRAAELARTGVDALDSREASIYVMAPFFGVAAGIGQGLQKRSPTAGFTTAKQLVTAALLSTAAGAVINAETDKAGNYVTGIGVFAASTGAGMLLGVKDEIKPFPLRMAGIAMFGVAAGIAAPIAWDTLRGVGGDLQRGVEHREN